MIFFSLKGNRIDFAYANSSSANNPREASGRKFTRLYTDFMVRRQRQAETSKEAENDASGRFSCGPVSSSSASHRSPTSSLFPATFPILSRNISTFVRGVHVWADYGLSSSWIFGEKKIYAYYIVSVKRDARFYRCYFILQHSVNLTFNNSRSRLVILLIID